MAKIVELARLVGIIDDLHKQNKRVALVHGCFDIIHVGHIHLFNFAKSESDVLIVGVLNNELVKHYKGEERPLFDLKDRLEVISNLSSVDYAFSVNIAVGTEEDIEKHHYKLYLELKPDVVVSAAGDKESEYKKNRCEKMGITFVADPVLTENRTSVIARKLGL